MNANKIVKKLKATEKKRNYTFSIKAEVVDQFQKYCESQGISMSSVIEEMMKEFLASTKKA